MTEHIRTIRNDAIATITIDRPDGNVLTLDEGLKDSVAPLLWVLDELPKDHEFMGLDAATRRTRTLEAVKRSA